jgi:hypothetical protein
MLKPFKTASTQIFQTRCTSYQKTWFTGFYVVSVWFLWICVEVNNSSKIIVLNIFRVKSPATCTVRWSFFLALKSPGFKTVHFPPNF